MFTTFLNQNEQNTMLMSDMLPDQLAVIVQSEAGYVGHVVVCIDEHVGPEGSRTVAGRNKVIYDLSASEKGTGQNYWDGNCPGGRTRVRLLNPGESVLLQA